MYFLKSRKDSNFWRFGWHFLFAFLILVSVILGGIGWCVRQSSESAGTTLLTVGICLGILSIVYAVFSGLLLALEIVRSLKTNGEKLDNSAEMLARQNTLLAQISQGVRQIGRAHV